MKKMIYQIRV